MSRWAVIVPKYSHEGSGFAYIKSLHNSQGDADRVAAALRTLGYHRFIRVEQVTAIAKEYDNA